MKTLLSRNSSTSQYGVVAIFIKPDFVISRPIGDQMVIWKGMIVTKNFQKCRCL